MPRAPNGTAVRVAASLRQMPEPRDLPSARRSPRLFLRSVWGAYSSDSRDNLSGHADVAANVVLRNLSVRDDAARRFGQGATEGIGRNLQDRVPDRSANSQAD